VLICHLRLHALYDNKRSTNTTSVAGNVDRLVVVVDVYAHEFVNLPSSSEFSELSHKASWEPRQANDQAIEVDDEGSGAVYFGTSR